MKGTLGMRHMNEGFVVFVLAILIHMSVMKIHLVYVQCGQRTDRSSASIVSLFEIGAKRPQKKKKKTSFRNVTTNLTKIRKIYFTRN